MPPLPSESARSNEVSATPQGVGSVSGVAKTSAGAGVVGEMIFLDTNNNGLLDPGELFTTTSSSGAYSFSGVLAGAPIVRQILPAGYKQTSPSSNFGIHITIQVGKSLTNQNFIDAIST
jgi:hypothetical protein